MFEAIDEISAAIVASYEGGITIPEAEKLASRILAVMLSLSEELKVASLDARMRKTGTKAARANVYLTEVSKHDKKPSDSLLENIVNADISVRAEQKSLDEADVNYEYLENQMSILREAHIHFRGIAKGRFE